MKTKTLLFLTTTLLFSSPGLRAGLTSDTLSVLSPAPAPAPAPFLAPRPLDQLDEAGIIAILIGMLHGDDDSDVLHPSADPAMAMWQQLESPITGDGGADSLWGEMGTDSARLRVNRAMLSIYGEGGADSVHRSLQQLARFVMGVDRFTCDPMDDGSLTGDAGDDEFAPSLRPMRLQRVADAFVGDPWMKFLFPAICGGNGNDSVAAGDFNDDGFSK